MVRRVMDLLHMLFPDVPEERAKCPFMLRARLAKGTHSVLRVPGYRIKCAEGEQGVPGEVRAGCVQGDDG